MRSSAGRLAILTLAFTASACTPAVTPERVPSPSAAPSMQAVDPTPSAEPTITRTTAPSPTAPEARVVTPSATIDVGHALIGLLVAEDAVWVGSSTGITPIDPDTNDVGEEIEVPNDAGFYGFGFGSMWVSDYHASLVHRVDPTTGAIEASIETGANPEGIAFTSDAVWVANHHDGSVTRIDPSSDTVLATIEVGSEGQGGPQHIVASDDAVWVGVPNGRAVVRINPTANAMVARIHTSGTPCGQMTLVADQLWVTTCEASAMVIDVATDEEVGRLSLGGTGGGTFGHDDRVWISVLGRDDTDPGRLVAIDPDTIAVTDVIQTQPRTYSAALGFGDLWAAAEGLGVVSRFPEDVLRASSGD
jgi:virginiamycin B lyase